MDTRSRVLLGSCVVLTVLFFFVFSAREISLFSTAGHDDYLFASQAHRLAAGSWLGRYNNLTLIKGVAFPFFLALSHFTSLPYPAVLSLYVAACCAYFGYVSWRMWRNVHLSCAIYVLLLLTPGLFQFIRVTREMFYGATTLALVASALHLLYGSPRNPRRVAILAGILGAVFWLTREEGVWLLPALSLALAVAALWSWREKSWSGLKADVLGPVGISAAVCTAVLCAVAFINLAVYGQFTLNEVKGRPFQSAMIALQKAAYPDWRAFVPVPRDARMRVYEVSPTFHTLKGFIDPPKGSWGHQATCQYMRASCGDIGGGWFLWVLRDAAASVGAHATASTAASFYRRLADEIEEACDAGRLTCAPYMLPLVPPMTRTDIPRIAQSAWRGFLIVGSARPERVIGPDSTIAAGFSDRMLHVLNRPLVQGLTVDSVVTLTVGVQGASQTLAATTTAPNRIIETRNPAGRSSDPPAQPMARSEFKIECLTRPCNVSLALSDRPVAVINLHSRSTGPGPIAADGGAGLTIEAFERVSFNTMRDDIASAFLAAVPVVQRFYLGLNLIGALAFLGLIALQILQRRASVYLVVSGALATGIVARVVLVALVDALSFPATATSYLIPATLLTTVFSVVALAGLAEAVRSVRARRVAA